MMFSCEMGTLPNFDFYVKFSTFTYINSSAKISHALALLIYNIKALASARGSEKNKKKKKPNRPKSEGSCQRLYMFLTTQSKKSNLIV